MSSETSTESAAAFRPWHFFVVAALGAATAAVMLSPRSAPEHLILVSLTVFAAGGAAIAFYRLLVPLVRGEQTLRRQPVGVRTRAVIEREKALVLRSIKELEFDWAMGKVSEDDFAEMSQRLRGRAVRLMQQLDEAGVDLRGRIEQELDARLGAAPAPTRPPCPACGTSNDADARFCKECGGRLHA